MTKPRQPRTKSSPFFIEPFSVSVAGAAAYTGLSEDTIKQACRDRKLAHRLKRGVSTLGEYQCDPATSGKRGPIATLEIMCSENWEAGHRDRALLPIRYLAARFGHTLVKEKVSGSKAADLLHEALSDAAEAADVTRAIQDAIKDGTITADEKDNILRQLEERDESSRRVRDALASATSKKKGKGK